MFKRNLPVIEESHLKRHAFIKVTYRVKNCPVEMINTVINVMSKKIKQDSVKFTSIIITINYLTHDVHHSSNLPMKLFET
ncbi:hypothetical protein T02_10406 [Trichinella nativa]|uniref:Uncharacterized protein n=1 Tax=Trichinella nativa TaxID=6335 RepID=A0A0V1KYC0_9BILA|nr:hypothetical protein T02_10406 [Trichinella nativa]